MHRIPFFFCVVLTALLVACYITKHNRLTALRIQTISLEKMLKSEEATKKRLEVELATFLSPLRLQEIARKAQYAHLHQPAPSELYTLEQP